MARVPEPGCRGAVTAATDPPYTEDCKYMNTELEPWIDDEQRRALAAPIEAARGLPGRACSADFYALEQARRC